MRFYLYTDSSIWRIPHSLLRKVGTVDWDDWYEMLMDHGSLAIWYNWRRDRWPESQVPKGLHTMFSEYGEGGTTLGSSDNKVKVMRLYEADEGEMLYWKETFLD
jgi:hypothetical protein